MQNWPDQHKYQQKIEEHCKSSKCIKVTKNEHFLVH